MKEYLFYLMVCIIFVLLYNLVSVHGKKNTYIFFILTELVIISYGIALLFTNFVLLPATIVLQIAFLIFINNHKKNISRNKIFEMIKSNIFFPVMITGVNGLSEKEYEDITKLFNKLFDINFDVNKKIFLLISYQRKKMTVRYIFLKSQDLQKYIYNVDLDSTNILEKEDIGKGSSMVYVCDI